MIIKKKKRILRSNRYFLSPGTYWTMCEMRCGKECETKLSELSCCNCIEIASNLRVPLVNEKYILTQLNLKKLFHGNNTIKDDEKIQ